MTTADLSLTAKDAWLIVKREESIEVSYAQFCRWLWSLGIVARMGIDHAALQVVRHFARVKSGNPTCVRKSGNEKILALKAIASIYSISGADLLALAIDTGACSKAQLYRRAQQLLGESYSTRSRYTQAQARQLITGY